jgi:4-amino-4-deoxy-L-arabinose transferase-like glycosyltransferase
VPGSHASTTPSRIVRVSGAVERVLLHRAFPVVCVLAALLVRVVWIALIQAEPISDYQWYYSQGVRIAEGKGYSVDHDGFPLWSAGRPLATPRPTAFWPVGYPAFLGALFRLTSGAIEPFLAAKLANAVLYVGLLLALAYTATLIFESKLAGRATLLFVGFIPNHIAYTTLTSVEIYFATLVAIGVALVLYAKHERRWPALGGAGLVFGLASLTKPQSVLLPGLLLLLLNGRQFRRLIVDGACIYVPIVLVQIPWTLRNFEAFDKLFFVSTNGWMNLAFGNTPGGFGNEGLMWNRELHDIVMKHNTELAWNEAAKHYILDYLRANPARVLLGLPNKFLQLYMADVDGFGWNRAADAAHAGAWFWTPLRVLSQLYYLACLSLAAVSIVTRWRSHGRYFAVGPLLIAYFTAIYLVFFGGARFHFPVVPWLALYAAGLFAELLHKRAAVTQTAQPATALAR